MLATDSLAKLGKTRWPKFVWPKMVTPVEGLGGSVFRVQCSGFRVQSSGFRVKGLGFMVLKFLGMSKERGAGEGPKNSQNVIRAKTALDQNYLLVHQFLSFF